MLREAELRGEERALDSFISQVGLDVLRGAVVGAVCVALPSASPAILALNEAYKAGRAAQAIYRAYSDSEAHLRMRAAATKAAEIAAAETISRVVGSTAEPVLKHAASSFGEAVAAQRFLEGGLDPSYVRILAEGTAYQAMKEGLGGIVSWSIKHAAG